MTRVRSRADGRARHLLPLIALPLVAASCAAAPYAAAATSPDLLVSKGEHLAAVRERLRAGDESLGAALALLRAEADRTLSEGPWSVVQKSGIASGSDPHDYRSLGPYWWPDPARPDGLPWIRRDGERNPQAGADGYDRARFGRLRDAVDTLGLAYFLTGHEPYAAHSARLLRTWFLDPATRMNPHLRYAQAIPGHNTGRGIGIIETARLPQLVDRAELLAGSPAWSDADRRGLREWTAAYLDWLLSSSHGKDEARMTNNHGSWYDVQVAALALRTGRPGSAREQLGRVTRRRIAAQIEPDGRQPRELERTRALAYSLFNLEALLTAAILGVRVEVDLWTFQTEDGRSLDRALEFLLPFTDPAVKWPHAQITDVPWATFSKVLRIAYQRSGDPRLVEAHDRLPRSAREDYQNALLFPSFELGAARR